MARFSKSRNDLSWDTRIDGETLRWTGYNDDYWWDKVSKSGAARERVTKTGRRFVIDFETSIVTEIGA
jgi:hypothetical protein